MVVVIVVVLVVVVLVVVVLVVVVRLFVGSWDIPPLELWPCSMPGLAGELVPLLWTMCGVSV